MYTLMEHKEAFISTSSVELCLYSVVFFISYNFNEHCCPGKELFDWEADMVEIPLLFTPYIYRFLCYKKVFTFLIGHLRGILIWDVKTL